MYTAIGIHRRYYSKNRQPGSHFPRQLLNLYWIQLDRHREEGADSKQSSVRVSHELVPYHTDDEEL